MLLVFLNIAMAFLVAWNPDLVNVYGFNARAPEVRTAFTCLFLHANTLHLFGNMVFLAAVGSAVEMSTGVVRYLLVYFLSGIAGVVLHFAFTRQLAQPAMVIGASGSVAGCVGYFALRYRTVRIEFLPRLSLPVYAVTLIWAVFQAIGAIVNLGSDGGTAFWSHIGGFAFGVLLSLVFRTPDYRMTVESRDRVRRAAVGSPLAVKATALAHLRDHPHDPEVLETLANVCRDLGDRREEVEALLRLQAVQLGEDRDQTLFGLHEIGQLPQLSRMERQRYVETRAEEAPRLTRLILESLIAECHDSSMPDLLLQLASFDKDRDPDAFRVTVRRILDEFPLSPAAELVRMKAWTD